MIKMIKKVASNVYKDQNGGPALEEALLLVFIGLVAANAADQLGSVLDSSYTKATNTLKTALGI